MALIAFQGLDNGPAGMARGVLFAMLILGSVFFHELGHAFAARSFRLFPIDITLHALGGYTRHAPSSRPVQGVLVTAAGPACSLLLSGVLYGLAQVVPNLFLVSFFSAGASLNLTWFFFNLLPMYPLDGGQILYHGLSSWTRRATAELWAARVGVVTAAVVGGLAVWSGSWMLFIIVVLCLQRSLPMAFKGG